MVKISIFSSPNLPSAIISQFTWFNKKKYKLINRMFFFYSLSNKRLNFVGLLFDREGKLKTFECLKDELSLTNSQKFKLFQIIHALPKQLMMVIRLMFFCRTITLLKINQVYALSNLDSKEFYKT